MEITDKKITIKELVEGYVDNSVEGVVGYNGKLDIRPPYQREFVYNEKQRNAVINTVNQGFPLNVMYWSKQDDGKFEIIDGQQRTVSLCKYVEGKFSFNEKYYHNLTQDQKDKFDNYKLSIYVCSGTDHEKLEWFKIINIAGATLTDQELKNAIYSGTWLTEAKKYFSKPNCPAYNISNDYVTGSPIRQDYLEKALEWISDGNIKDYMAKNQHEQNANELWQYFQAVITWIESTFVEKRKYMKTVDWGTLYKKRENVKVDTEKFEKETKELIDNDEVTKKSGIYPYIITREEKYLNIRAFTDSTKQKVYEKQNKKCKICEKEFDISKVEADHIDPWTEGGKTVEENCQVLCKNCNRTKSSK